MKWKKIVRRSIGGLVVLFLAIQVIPYGHNHTNPPVQQEPTWDDPQTRELVVDACYDCHSNESTWPWYSNVAPVSWLVQNDVEEGRRILNFSEWGSQRLEAEEVIEVIREGEMPPFYYTMMHDSAKLSTAEKNTLIQGLQATGIAAR